MPSNRFIPPPCLITAVFLLAAVSTVAQLKLNTSNPYETKKDAGKSGASNTAPQIGYSAGLHVPIPNEITNYSQFQNNLVILNAALDENQKPRSNCKVETTTADVSINDAAILHLYLNDGFAACLLAVKTAQAVPEKSADLPRRINNLGAILIELGQIDAAIPYLKYAATMDANNPSILNNLGQAYAYKKEYTLATVNLNAALKIVPNHPLANLTMAYVNQSGAAANQGADSKAYSQDALANAKTALKGGFLTHAWQMVQRSDQDARLQDLVKDKVTPVYYIHADEPPIPTNSTSVHQAYALSRQQQKWFKEVDKLIKYYDSVSSARLELAAPKKADEAKLKQQAYQMIAEGQNMRAGGSINIAKIRSMNARVQALVGKVIPVYDAPFTDYAFHLRSSLERDRAKDNENRKEIGVPWIGGVIANTKEQLNKEIEETTASILSPQDRKEAIDNISDKYLVLYDTELQNWRRKRWEWDKKYFNWRLFWLYVEEKDEYSFYGQFCVLMSDFYDELKDLTIANWYIFPATNAEADKKLTAPEITVDSLKGRDISCPFTDLTVEAGVNHLIMNCRKKMDSKADESRFIGGCIPKGQKGVLSLTFLLGLDASLKNYLLVEDGIVMDNSITWDQNMHWDGATTNWWLNSGFSELKPNDKK